jgi:hypothetical protein
MIAERMRSDSKMIGARVLLLSLLATVLPCRIAAQQSVLYFPHVAAGGDWRSTILLSNSGGFGIAARML